MDEATMELVQGVTLEAIIAREEPDTDFLLGELGAEYPVINYPTDFSDRNRDGLDASIMAGLVWP